MSPGRIALGYVVLAILWIAFSDEVVTRLRLNPAVMTIKGIVFVFVTAWLLYLTTKRLVHALSRANRELRAISDCNQVLLRATDEQSLIGKICRIVCEEAGYGMAWVAYGEHDEAKSVRCIAWSGAEPEYLASGGVTWADTEGGTGPTGTAIRNGKTCCIQDFATDPRIVPWREGLLQRGFRSAIGLPLKDENDNAFGSLTIHSVRANAFGPEEIRLLEELAGNMAFGIVTLRSRAAREQAEEALRESETNLNRAQEIAHIGSWHLDISGNRLTWSDEVFRIFGEPTGTALTYEAFLDRVHPADRESVHNAWSAALHGAPYDIEHRIIVDGGVKWVRERAELEFSGEGKATSGIGTVQDITERKRDEEERRQSAERFRAIADYTYDWENWIGVDGKLLWVNPAVERITGYSVDECMAMADFPVPIVVEADRQEFATQMKEAVEGSSRNDFEFRVRRKDGHLAWVAASWQPIYDSRGARLGHRSSIRDIAERKRAEEALRDSEMRFRTFVDWAGDALFVEDVEQGIIVDVNREACRSLGYARQELMGRTPLGFHLDSDQARIEAATKRAAEGKPVFDRHLHRRKDGSVFPVEVHTNRISYGGRHLLLKLARDITDRVRAEEQREKLRQLESELVHTSRVSMLGELAASVSHELKQPVAAAALHAASCLHWLTSDRPDVHKASEAATRILDIANLADQIIDRLRSLYKKSPPKREPVDVNETINQMVALLLGEATRRGVSIQTEIADGLPKITADRVQLQQVLMNLMLNAVDAMHDTGGVLTVKAQLNQDRRVEVSVSDNGVGLPPGKADHIFDAFFTTKAQGSGMGLSISRSIVESHGGRIWATNNDGRGATFHVVLPIAAGVHVSTAD